MSKRTKIILAAVGGGGLLLLIVLVVGGIFIGRAMSRSARLAPFRANMDQYLRDNNEGYGKASYDKGKVLPIDVKAKDVDPIYFDLPADVAAQTPDEVGAVIRIQWGSQPVRTLEGGATRNQDYCYINVYDRDGHGLSATIKFEGQMPQFRDAPTMADKRSLNTKVIDWLKTLKPGVPLIEQEPDRKK